MSKNKTIRFEVTQEKGMEKGVFFIQGEITGFDVNLFESVLMSNAMDEREIGEVMDMLGDTIKELERHIPPEFDGVIAEADGSNAIYHMMLYYMATYKISSYDVAGAAQLLHQMLSYDPSLRSEAYNLYIDTMIYLHEPDKALELALEGQTAHADYSSALIHFNNNDYANAILSIRKGLVRNIYMCEMLLEIEPPGIGEDSLIEEAFEFDDGLCHQLWSRESIELLYWVSHSKESLKDRIMLADMGAIDDVSAKKIAGSISLEECHMMAERFTEEVIGDGGMAGEILKGMTAFNFNGIVH